MVVGVGTGVGVGTVVGVGVAVGDGMDVGVGIGDGDGLGEGLGATVIVGIDRVVCAGVTVRASCCESSQATVSITVVNTSRATAIAFAKDRFLVE